MERVRWPEVVARAREIVVGYGPLGVTLRQCFYRLAAEGTLPNTAPMYRRLSARLAQARRDGTFPDLLVDTLREVHVPPAWRDAAEFLAAVPGSFGLDRTEGQPAALYLAAEKDTLRALLTSWTAELGVPVLVVRGFGSQSYVDVVRRRAAADTRPAHLLYVGDFDASGEEIEADFIARTGCWASVLRVALTARQVERYALPPADGKAADPRWPAFAERHGLARSEPVQWEVEALDPAELRRLVLEAVEPFVDRAALARQIEAEAEQRERIEQFLARWGETER